MIDKKAIYAVVGASNNQQKYGYKVLQDLKNSGYQVIPINPHEKEILGLKVYKCLEDVKTKIDTVIFVVQPDITEKILFEVKNYRLKMSGFSQVVKVSKLFNIVKIIILIVSTMPVLCWR